MIIALLPRQFFAAGGSDESGVYSSRSVNLNFLFYKKNDATTFH